MVCILEIQQVFFGTWKGPIHSGVHVVDKSRSRKLGRGLLPPSHSDLSAMPIMFITPSGLPVARILAIHPSYTIPGYGET